MAQLLRGARKPPLRFIGSALLLVGIALLAASQSRGGWVRQDATSAPSRERSPILRSRSPTNPISTVDLLAEGSNIPADEERFGTSPQDESSVATAPATTQVTGANSIAEPATGIVDGAPPPTRLVIPALGIDAPIVEVPITNRTWDVSGLTYEIAHLGGTANPGEKNNMVLIGHVTLRTGAGPFLHLEGLELGDLAVVYAGEQAYTYRVVSKRYVEPTDVSVAHPTSDPILTMITCTNWDAENRTYAERVAVIAELVKRWTGLPVTWAATRLSQQE